MNSIKQIATLAMLALPFAAMAQIAFTGNDRDIFEVTPDNNTGLKKIYVLHDTEGVGMSYRATSMNPVTWFTYGEGGGGYAQELLNVIDDPSDPYVSSIAQVEPERGYIIEEGTTRHYIWVTDYSRYPLHLATIEADEDGDCNTVTLHVEGSGNDIPYYTITGARRILSRDLKLSYNNLLWDDEGDDEGENEDYNEPKPVTDVISGFKPVISHLRATVSWSSGARIRPSAATSGIRRPWRCTLPPYKKNVTTKTRLKARAWSLEARHPAT